jgi:tetratricopeptide (TPR) repeat protein
LHLLGRLPEARQAYQRGRSISPGDLFLVLTEAMTSLAEGHLDSARAVLRRTTRAIDATELAAFVASAEDLFWLLERGQQDTVVRLPPDYPVFGGNRGYWAIVHTEIYHLRGDTALARAWADTARREFDAVLRSRPFFTKADQYALRGLASAYLGRKEEAVRDGRRGVERALEVSDPWDTGYIRDVLARIYVLVGDPAAAVGQLDTIVRTPSFYSRAWFRIDPTLSPLRGHPAFERLVSSR